MAIELFLAMTEEELRQAPVLPQKIAWMACHFSAYGTGLSSLPQTLPPGSMLILNDRIAPQGQDPHRVAEQLSRAMQALDCAALLLDFERPDDPLTHAIAAQLLMTADRPVGISAPYAADLQCPVFLPPIPPHILPEDHLSPWMGREIWLEMALDGTCLTVTGSGCRSEALTGPAEAYPHHDPQLHCHYRTEVSPEQLRFCLRRTLSDLHPLLDATAPLGVTRAIGLYQELRSPEEDRDRAPDR